MDRPEIARLLGDARVRTLLLIAPLDAEALRAQHSPLMSPIVWDLGHIAHFEDLWLLRNIGPDPEGRTFGEIPGMYNPFENPRSVRGDMDLPSLRETVELLAGIRRRVLAHLETLDAGDDARLLADDFVFHLVAQHEYQHNETILQTLQLKKGDPYAAPRMTAVPAAPDTAPTGMVRFEGGEVVIGTDGGGAAAGAYDNERPAHTVEVAPFEIDVVPVTNAEYTAFIEDRGYDTRDHWSDAGWAWRTEQELEAPMYWFPAGGGWHTRVMDWTGPVPADHPVCHVTYYEAEAYAAWAGKRLPTEVEWETAASWDPWSRAKRLYPWGDELPTPLHANVDQLAFGTAPVGAYPRNVSPLGCHGMIGDVWEWTASEFGPWPGFESWPYDEYSKVFFGDEYRVLRGGSWATRPGAIRSTFRNWDYPIRRQIFAGFRCAR